MIKEGFFIMERPVHELREVVRAHAVEQASARRLLGARLLEQLRVDRDAGGGCRDVEAARRGLLDRLSLHFCYHHL